MLLYKILLFIFALAGMAMDLNRSKIDNRFILSGLIAGLIARTILYGLHGLQTSLTGMLLPVLLLGWLFVFRMMGAGDIKFFCALGAFIGTPRITAGIFYAFLAGSAIALLILLGNGILMERAVYFGNYVREVRMTKKILPYRQGGIERIENFHFSVPIFVAVMMYLGGMY